MMGPDPGEIEVKMQVKMQGYYIFREGHRIWAAIKTLKVGYSGQA
jgi:hypothetical protein